MNSVYPELSQQQEADGFENVPLSQRQNQDQLEEALEDEDETRCGLGPFHPQWLQRLVSKKSYVLVYGVMGMTRNIIGSYYGSTLSTIEKRFKIPSKLSGAIWAFVDISGIGAFLILSYLGNKGHKTRWVAFGGILVALTCFMNLLPHLIYGPGQDALELTLEYGGQHGKTVTNATYNNNDSSAFLCKSNYAEVEDCSGNISVVPLTIFFISFFIYGIGTCTYHTLGIAYMDDNTKKHKTPFLLAIQQCIMMIGPSIGFFIGSLALNEYVDLSVHPTITPEDPRWIGAWWIAWGPFTIMSLVMAFLLALFPRRLPQAAKRLKAAAAAGELVKKNTAASIADFKLVMKRLLKNKVLLYNSLSTVCFVLGLSGYYKFLPKYIETQFRQTASASSFITGTIGLLCSGLGVLASGIVISKFKPSARNIALWNVIVEVLDVIGHYLYSHLTCTVHDLHGHMMTDNMWNVTATCNADCDCGPSMKYAPVCSVDGNQTFYSACYAGCTTLDTINGTKMYGNCNCIGEDGLGTAVDGACPVDCSTYFTIYLVLRCILSFTSASGRAGNALVQFRCVDQDDKAVSIGFTEVLMCALAFVPGPILCGWLLDSACIVWGQTCGQPGNCWLYDGEKLGVLLNFTASGLLVIGTILDICVWYYVKDMEMYDKEEDTDENTRKGKKCKD